MRSMSEKLLLACALPDELAPDSLPASVRVIYTGMGKINAAMATQKAIYEARPSLILNLGTAGGLKDGLTGLLPIGRVVQRDVITLLAPRGQMPYCSRPQQYFSIQSSGHTCGTGDSFVTAHDPWFEHAAIDVVDMELYAIAAAAHEHNVPWMSFKYVSDRADDAAVDTWKRDKHLGQQLFLEALAKFL